MDTLTKKYKENINLIKRNYNEFINEPQVQQYIRSYEVIQEDIRKRTKYN